MSSERRPRRGFMLVVSSPSGVGKTSLSRRLVADHPDLELSTSATTRDPRPGEQDGREYNFIDRPTFDAMRVSARDTTGGTATSLCVCRSRRPLLRCGGCGMGGSVAVGIRRGRGR